MKRTIFENGIQYSLHDDYYLPDLQLIGRWGRMHRDYLKEHRPVVFTQIILSGNLWTYLADINEQAQQRTEVLITRLKSAEGITEELKEVNQMEWIQSANNIRVHAEEIVMNEMIYK